MTRDKWNYHGSCFTLKFIRIYSNPVDFSFIKLMINDLGYWKFVYFDYFIFWKAVRSYRTDLLFFKKRKNLENFKNVFQCEGRQNSPLLLGKSSQIYCFPKLCYFNTTKDKIQLPCWVEWCLRSGEFKSFLTIYFCTRLCKYSYVHVNLASILNDSWQLLWL